jgi:hypothetical protein
MRNLGLIDFLFARNSERTILLMVAVLTSLLYSAASAAQSLHKMTFAFDYDFSVTPACSANVQQACVQQFNVYDISGGIPKRLRLGSFPVPANASGLVKRISIVTKPRLFSPGRHKVAVSAQTSDGRESDLAECATIVEIE